MNKNLPLELVGRLPGEPNDIGIGSLAVQAKCACLVRSVGVEVVDISDPAAPTKVRFYEETGEFYHTGNIVIAEDYMYVFCGDQAGLFVFRIAADSDKGATPTKP